MKNLKKLFIAAVLILLMYIIFTPSPTALEKDLALGDYTIHDGNLIVINKDLKLQQQPKNLSMIPTTLATNVRVDSEHRIKQGLLQPLEHMFKAAESDGLYFFEINSTYRNNELQQKLYEENGSDYALPAGYSEHQSGLAIDIGSANGTMENSLEYAWLNENAAKFGFILRYPSNKVDITKIAFEPWHYRYVGLPHSIIMQEKDFALEEYIEFIQAEKQYTKKINGVKYFIQYAEKNSLLKFQIQLILNYLVTI